MAQAEATTVLDDYGGAFEPDFDFGRLSRAALARLGREYMLVGHVQSRVIMPIVATRFGPPAAAEFAIDAWRAASPVFNARNRRLLAIEGDGMSAILKGLQFDVGAPHQYMDFRFELVDETHGFFWLDYCGALDAVSVATNHDPVAIKRMCHDIEDPTFDATVMEVNPRARCRPVHRPPLAAGHTGPVCRWQVAITPDVGVVEEHPLTHAVRETRAGRFSSRICPVGRWSRSARSSRSTSTSWFVRATSPFAHAGAPTRWRRSRATTGPVRRPSTGLASAARSASRATTWRPS